MSFSALLARVGECVDIITPGTTTDGYGDEILSWDPDDVTTCRVLAKYTRAGSTRDRDGRDALITTDTLDLPAGTAIDGRCRVTVRGQDRDLDGEPYVTPGGHHIVVRLRNVEG